MDEQYIPTVRLLLLAAPEVFANQIFAMKGGTAINLFIRDMPRLSVDIDVAYTLHQTPREEALGAIADEMRAIASRLRRLRLAIREVASRELDETKLIVEGNRSQVKIEVNAVFRGTVLAPTRRALHPATAERFSSGVELPTLAVEELYGSKLVAALDRQHPRDIFDVWQMQLAGGMSEAMLECFVAYLAGHNRPMHEVLFGRDKDFSREFKERFTGMTRDPIELHMLVDARSAMRRELSRRLTDSQKRFLVSLARAWPDWGCCNVLTFQNCPHCGGDSQISSSSGSGGFETLKLTVRHWRKDLLGHR